jgi:hypothetical protein
MLTAAPRSGRQRWFAFLVRGRLYYRHRASWIAALVSMPMFLAGPSVASPVVDPEVRVRLHAGRTRVLVMLRIPEITDPQRRAEAIGRAQDAVLARLPQAHASVVRRYASIPMLALEVDPTALSILETMSDVAGVQLDRTVPPQ